VPNGEKRDRAVGGKLKALGVLRGVADLAFLWPGPAGPHVLFLELKAKRRRPTAVQNEFAKLARLVGAYYEVADTIDRAVDVLRRFQLLR
jgi:hypothetical protein